MVDGNSSFIFIIRHKDGFLKIFLSQLEMSKLEMAVSPHVVDIADLLNLVIHVRPVYGSIEDIESSLKLLGNDGLIKDVLSLSH